MSGFYDEMAAVADEILKEFGGPAVLSRVTPAAYDPTTGTTTGETTTTWPATGAKFDYEQNDIDGTKIRQGDQRVYLSTIGVVNPQTGDTLTIAGTAYNVVASRPLQPALVAVLFDVQVRGVL
ncbi:hypothetical protein [Variovorax ginsengisoli]|uniref:Head-tail joining protein n=1 Tax=Variovorax ginsengisoli TaxID=363844 RepID=A0ABT8RZG0_9BURK|nr:hypothetical protein [Variovorax ginsengisoli]MDN8612795.1 hypothetical protein [Variovorax ginsengisoli]MDO1531965.1 hypothetical protein [Variovorax ginsengisoli]